MERKLQLQASDETTGRVGSPGGDGGSSRREKSDD